MTAAADITAFAPRLDLDWHRRHDQDLWLADVRSAAEHGGMTVGFAHYGAGEQNPWTVTYDEALVVITGRFTVEGGGVSVTAGPGEAIYLRSGTELLYRADEDVDLVYVTHPDWMTATEASPHASRLDEFQPGSRS